MTNEEFQNIVLAEIKALRQEMSELKQGQEEVKKELRAVIEHTADLTEFREETNAKLDTLIEENEIIKEITGRHEVDIRRLKRNII